MPNISNSTACASILAYDKLKARIDLTGVEIKHDDEADVMTAGIQISVMSPGIDNGLTDGSRDLGDPLVMVLGIGSTLMDAATLNVIIDQALENATGANAFGRVIRCARERPHHNTTKTASKQTRFLVGGFYRFTVVSLDIELI